MARPLPFPVLALVALLLAALVVPFPARAASHPAAPAAGPAAPAAATDVKPAPKERPAPKGEQAPEAPPIALIPKGWERSIYNLDARVVTGVADVTFDAPPEYQESFAFWTGRMKGGQRTELIQLLTTTRETAKDGSVPFHRQVSRYQVDIFEQGQIKTTERGLTSQVTALAWDGALDPQGNVRDISRTGWPENPTQFEALSLELVDRLFPRLGQRREMKRGDSFLDKISMPLPQRLAVKGLDEMKVVVTRAFTLREVRDNEATFEVKITYEADPGTPPTAPRTTCAISGGGTGEAVFDREEGQFVRSELQSQMVIELEAPLRHLPDQPEGFDPGTARSRIVLALTLSGKQILARLFNPSPEAPAEGKQAVEERPAPGF